MHMYIYVFGHSMVTCARDGGGPIQTVYPPLETTQGQIDGFLSQLPFKCCLPGVAFVGN